MKRIIMIATVIVVAAVTVRAQSPRAEVRMADVGFKGLAFNSQSAAKKSSDSLQQAVERQISRCAAKKTAQQNKKTVTSNQATARATTPAVKKTSQKPAEAKDNSKRVRQFLKTVFWGGPFPGETTEAYHERLLVQMNPASLPYK